MDAASADLKKMLSGKADDRDIYVSLANTYEKGKRWDEMGKALDAAEKLSDSTEDKSGIWFMRGAMLERMKKLDKAEVEFRKVLKANPDNAGAMNYIGYMLADANLRLEESLDLITKALDIEPGNGAYLDSLGWVQFRLGRLEDAEKNLRRALDKTPRDPTVHDHMAEHADEGIQSEGSRGPVGNFAQGVGNQFPRGHRAGRNRASEAQSRSRQRAPGARSSPLVSARFPVILLKIRRSSWGRWFGSLAVPGARPAPPVAQRTSLRSPS